MEVRRSQMKASIIVPVYNSEKYIEKCLDSIMKQTYKNFELILIDDGSKDNSGLICDQYAIQYSDIIKVYHTHNGGPSKARNLGIEKALGDYIQFVDADDSIPYDCIEQFTREVSQFPADCIIGNAVAVDPKGKPLQLFDVGRESTCRAGELIERMTLSTKAQYLHYIWNKWYKAEILRKNHLSFQSDVYLGEDFLFNCSFLSFSKTITLFRKEIYYYYKRDNLSLTQRDRRGELQRRRLMDNALVNLYQHFNILDKRKDIVNSCIGSIALLSMESVGEKGCTLNVHEKAKFLNTFMNSEYYDYMMAYRNNRHSVIEALELFFVRRKMPMALLAVIEARYYKSRLLRLMDGI